MHEIDTTYSQNGDFVDATPPSTQGTVVDAAWLNAVQRELLNVISAAGMTPSKNDQTQLAQAISQLAAVGTAIRLEFWQTDPDQYTVLAQDAFDSDGEGRDLLYKYVFPAGVLSIMYTQVLLPFSGYDLQLCFPYRMSSSASGNVVWYLYYRIVSANESYSEIADWTGWTSADDTACSYTHTPSATANQRNLISGSNLVIPSSAYAAYETLQMVLCRATASTHTGDAEVDDSILLVPVLPSE